MSVVLNDRAGWGLLVTLLLLASSAAAVPAQAPQPRIPLPDSATLDQRLGLFRDVFGREYDEADTPAKKLALADKLLQHAIQTHDDAASRLILFRMGRDVAAEAGDARKALEAADAISTTFEVDGLQVRVETLTEAAPSARSPAQCAGLATVAVMLVDEALAEDRCEVAGQLADLALAAARSSRDTVFVKRIVAWEKRLDAVQEAYRKVATALAALKAKPTDPEANLVVGEFLAFGKGRWEKAISHLALGSDAELKAQAQSELKAPASPGEQVTLADGWWRLAETAEGEAQAQLRAHAAEWYGKALPQLTGLSKAKVEARLAEVGTSDMPAGRLAFEGVPDRPIPGEITDLKAVYGTKEKSVDVTEIVGTLHGADPFAPIHVAGARFGDPAPGQTKHLYLQYRFGRHPIRRTVRGGGFETIPVLPSQGIKLREATQVLTVLGARYGAHDAWMDVTAKVARLVGDPTMPYRFGVADAGEDPLSGVNKVLVVWFDYRGVRFARILPTERPGTLLP